MRNFFALFIAVSLHSAVFAEVQLKSIIRGLSEPIYMADPNDGTGRFFIVEKNGKIKILSKGEIASRAFLDISSLISTEGERGLLGLAFDPKFKSNRRFFVFYTRKSDGAIQLSSFLVSTSNKNRADRGSERKRLRISHSRSNHNGGQIVFGPDNLLYMGTGDGGGGGDPDENGQRKNTLLGKILRLDVSASSGYKIPTRNPFRTKRGYKKEIYALGLRNPWRFSFDKVTKRLFVGDVGQGDVEEVDIVRSGNNLGWNIMEGDRCFSPSSNCDQTGLTLPISTYTHDEGQSITGGYVYRGKKAPSLNRKYIFGDFVSGRVWTLTENTTTKAWTREELMSTHSAISSFAQDRNGEVYLIDYGAGEIFRFEE